MRGRGEKCLKPKRDERKGKKRERDKRKEEKEGKRRGETRMSE